MEEKVPIMRTGYGNNPISFRDSMLSQLSRWAAEGQRASPSSQSFQIAGPIFLQLFRAFQEASELSVSGQLDDATRARMRQPRCGLEDPFNQKTLKYLMLGKA